MPASWWRWVVGDISGFAFYKHELASIGLLAGAALAYFGSRNGKAWAGFPICYGTGLWPWLIISSLLGLLLSNLLWGWMLVGASLATHLRRLRLTACGHGAAVRPRLAGGGQRRAAGGDADRHQRRC